MVPVRLGQDVVGVVAALAATSRGSKAAPAVEAGPWLDAAAAAAAVAALMRDSSEGDLQHARRAFLQMLEMHAHTDTEALLSQARRLGYDFSAGVVAVAAALDSSVDSPGPDMEALGEFALVADVGEQRLLGLAPLGGTAESPGAGVEGAAEAIAHLRGAGLPAVASAPRRTAEDFQDALQESAILLELLVDAQAMLKAHEDTYRLLVGVLIRDPEELSQLRASTIAPLEQYDATHDTELVSTLDTFLTNHGSTTDTAEAMQLHRHTVGYRLARVQEVSGLSPYESEGRERLGLGLKAHRILLAENRRAGRVRPA